MKYIPDGLTAEQWEAIQVKEKAAAKKNLGSMGKFQVSSKTCAHTHAHHGCKAVLPCVLFSLT